jgi:hypothetical protein
MASADDFDAELKDVPVDTAVLLSSILVFDWFFALCLTTGVAIAAVDFRLVDILTTWVEAQSREQLHEGRGVAEATSRRFSLAEHQLQRTCAL